MRTSPSGSSPEKKQSSRGTYRTAVSGLSAGIGQGIREAGRPFGDGRRACGPEIRFAGKKGTVAFGEFAGLGGGGLWQPLRRLDGVGPAGGRIERLQREVD